MTVTLRSLALMVPAITLLLIQFVPYGRDHSNPPDGTMPVFDSPTTQHLAQRACFDCHSNRTRWPWYASIAPVSWRIQHHVSEGRDKLNFSAFDPTGEGAAETVEEAGESVTEGTMPPLDYLLVHPEARLSPAESVTLAAGLDATFAPYRRSEADEREGDRD